MTMEKQAFEDLSPSKNGDVPVSFQFSGRYSDYNNSENECIYIYQISI